jgi:hypothetical protein
MCIGQALFYIVYTKYTLDTIQRNHIVQSVGYNIDYIAFKYVTMVYFRYY